MQFNPVKICINSHPPLVVVGAQAISRARSSQTGGWSRVSLPATCRLPICRRSAGRFARHTPADQVEAVGNRWSYTYWNPGSNEHADGLDDLVPRNVDRPIGLSDSVSEPEA
jgi:hypothetical protein